MRRRSYLMPMALFAAGCAGDGSDIGPRLQAPPGSSSQVDVLDTQSRGVAGAVVTIGPSIRGVTGRGGRADVYVTPTGRFAVTVDGANAAASAGDRLGRLTVAVTSAGGDLPYALHLPDVAGSPVLDLAVGTQATAQTLADPTGIQGSLVLAPGSSIGLPTSAANVSLRVAPVPRALLPGDLPSGAVYLFSNGVYVDPPEVTFTAADLTTTDAEFAAAGPVLVFRLDPDTGEWTALADGTATGGGVLTATGVPGGGLYVFAVAVAAGAVRGRVVDLAGAAVPTALVTVDGRHASTGGDGRFAVAGIPAVDAGGAPRSAAIEVVAGGAWLTRATTAAVAMNGANEVDAGDLVLDTALGGALRVQQVRRARAEPLRLCRVGSLLGGVVQATVADDRGEALFDDVPAGWFGFLLAFPHNEIDVYYARAVGHYNAGRRWADVYQFYDLAGWIVGSRTSRVQVCDAIGGGPLYDVAVVRGSVDGEGFLQFTRENGAVSGDRLLAGRITASLRSERAGQVVVHAFSIEGPDGEHLELPMRQVLRAPFGAFDRHGVVAGTLSGATPGREHRLRASRRIELGEWWDDVVENAPIRSALPIDVDPATTHDSYRVGVDRAGGDIAIAEVATAGAVTTLHALALATDVQVTEGGLTPRDLALDRPATTAFAAPGVLSGLDAGIAVGDLAFDLALELPTGLAVDVVRGINGNLATTGNDVALQLPALAAGLEGDSWQALLRGEATVGPETVRQCTRLAFSAAGATIAEPLLAVPAITSPVPAATAARDQFTVQFALPAGATYGRIELRSDDAGETAIHEALVPPTATSFKFQLPPPNVHDPLVAGRTYSLTLTAYRIVGGPLAGRPNPYPLLSAYYLSIGAVERGVVSCSSRTRTVTLQ
ncbi:MAG: hypothetical protein U1E73_03200 [Planctomycetota bacterium]